MNHIKTSEVFGLSPDILPLSYVDRANLDEVVTRDLARTKHIALRGESKCGKSWLRQKLIPGALVVQCRLNKDLEAIYRDIFSQLGISVAVERHTSGSFQSTFSAETEAGASLIAKFKATFGLTGTTSSGEKSIVIGQDLDDLNFIAKVVLLSGRRLVIEDFHYLHPRARERFAHDLKTLWDLKVFCIVIGIWTDNNMLVHLCPDLSNRIVERSVYWTDADLSLVIEKGCRALNLELDNQTSKRLVQDSFGTVGLLQTLILSLLDEISIFESFQSITFVDGTTDYQDVAMDTAEQLNAVYQTFASRVVNGIRKRKNSTGIYAHALKVVMESSDEELSAGIHTDKIFQISKQREQRIQKPNLRQILGKLEGLQVDSEGRGLILSYVRSRDEVTVVDKQLFFYRKYATLNWPWDKVLEDLRAEDDTFSEDDFED